MTDQTPNPPDAESEEPAWMEHYPEDGERLRDVCAEAADAIDSAINQFVITDADAAVEEAARAWAIAEIDRLLTTMRFNELIAEAKFREGGEDFREPGNDQ